MAALALMAAAEGAAGGAAVVVVMEAAFGEAAAVALAAVPKLVPRAQEGGLDRRAREARRVGLFEPTELNGLQHAAADGADDRRHEGQQDDWLAGRGL